MSDLTCSMCSEAISEERAIVGDAAVICPECVWMCVDILAERGEARPTDGDEFDEKSEIHPRGSIPPPK